MRSLRGRQGIVIVVLSGILALLLILALAFLGIARLYGGLSRAASDGARLRLGRASGVEYAAARLTETVNPMHPWSVENRGESWEAREVERRSLRTLLAMGFKIEDPEVVGELKRQPLSVILNPSYSHGPSWADLEEAGVPETRLGVVGRIQGIRSVREAHEPASRADDPISGRLRGGTDRFGYGFTLRVESAGGRLPVNAGLLDAQDRPREGRWEGGRIVWDDLTANGIPDHRDLSWGPNAGIALAIDNLGTVLGIGRRACVHGTLYSSLGQELISMRPPGGYRSMREIQEAMRVFGYPGEAFEKVAPLLTLFHETSPQCGVPLGRSVRVQDPWEISRSGLECDGKRVPTLGLVRNRDRTCLGWAQSFSEVRGEGESRYGNPRLLPVDEWVPQATVEHGTAPFRVVQALLLYPCPGDIGTSKLSEVGEAFRRVTTLGQWSRLANGGGLPPLWADLHAYILDSFSSRGETGGIPESVPLGEDDTVEERKRLFWSLFPEIPVDRYLLDRAWECEDLGPDWFHNRGWLSDCFWGRRESAAAFDPEESRPAAERPRCDPIPFSNAPPSLFEVEAIGRDGSGAGRRASPEARTILRVRQVLSLTSQEDFEGLDGRTIPALGLSVAGRGTRPAYETAHGRRQPHAVTLPRWMQESFRDLEGLAGYPRYAGAVSLASLEAGPRGADLYWPLREAEPGGKEPCFPCETRPEDPDAAIRLPETAFRWEHLSLSPWGVTTQRGDGPGAGPREPRFEIPASAEGFPGLSVEGWMDGFRIEDVQVTGGPPGERFRFEARIEATPSKAATCNAPRFKSDYMPFSPVSASKLRGRFEREGISCEFEGEGLFPGKERGWLGEAWSSALSRLGNFFRIAGGPEEFDGWPHLAGVIEPRGERTILRIYVNGRPVSLRWTIRDELGSRAVSGDAAELLCTTERPGRLSLGFQRGKDLRVYFHPLKAEEVSEVHRLGHFVPFGDYYSPVFVFDRPTRLSQAWQIDAVHNFYRDLNVSPIEVEVQAYADVNASDPVWRVTLPPSYETKKLPDEPARSFRYHVRFECRGAGGRPVLGPPLLEQIGFHLVPAGGARILHQEGETGRGAGTVPAPAPAGKPRYSPTSGQ